MKKTLKTQKIISLLQAIVSFDVEDVVGIVLDIGEDGFEGQTSFGGSIEEFGSPDADIGEEQSFTCQFGTGKNEAEVAIWRDNASGITLRKEFVSFSADGIPMRPI